MTVDLNKLSEAYKARYDKFGYKVFLESEATVIDPSKNTEEFMHIAEKLDVQNNKPEDFVILKSVLCTSLPYVNKNGVAFKAEDLVNAVNSGQLGSTQPAILDWRHNFVPMGNTFSAEIKEDEIVIGGMDGNQQVKHIVVYSVFYSWLFPWEAENIRKWASKGILKFSMACGADDVDMVNGSRVLVNPQFMANSIIPPDADPADDNAGLLALAQSSNKQIVDNNVKDVEMDEKILALQEQIKTLTKDLEKRDTEIANLKTSAKTSEVNKELETAKADLGKLSNDLEVANKELETVKDSLKTAKEELEASKKEVTDLSAKYEATVKEVNDIKQAEVDAINKDRETVLAELIDDKDSLEHYTKMYSASLEENGIISDKKEDFDRFLALFGKEVKSVDAKPSGLVIASANAAVVPSKATGNEKDKIPADWE